MSDVFRRFVRGLARASEDRERRLELLAAAQGDATTKQLRRALDR